MRQGKTALKKAQEDLVKAVQETTNQQQACIIKEVI